MNGATTPFESEAVVRGVMGRLFTDPALNTFAILDGAAIPDLLPKLQAENPEHACLYRGELEPDLKECAPYLVRLTSESVFTRWVVAHGWGNHWGIFLLSEADLNTLRRHLRGFLMVMSPEGKRLYFRYYDPRVLRVYLPTANVEETRKVFGPVGRYFCEGEKPETLFLFSAAKLGTPQVEVIALTA